MKISLFLDNFNRYWSSKPPWCQPWSVIFSGLIVISLVYILIPFFLIKLLITLLISLWWYLFLILAPSIDNESKDLE